LIPEPPGHDDATSWSAVARMFERWADELAISLLTFGDVYERAADLDLPLDPQRWRTADAVFCRYEAVLERWGHADPMQSARRSALSSELDDERDVVLVCVSELSALARACVGPCVSLVYASDVLADRFDELGCVATDAWSDCDIVIEDDCLVFESTPTEQAQAAFGAIARSGGRYGPDEIVIGATDDQLASRVERAGSRIGVTVRASVGIALDQTGPIRLLHAAGDHLDDRRFDSLASLARHTGLERALIERLGTSGGVEDWIGAFDDYANEHLPTGVPEVWLGRDDGRNQALERVTGAIGGLLGELCATDKNGSPSRRPLSEWADPIGALITAVYGGREWSLNNPVHRRVIDACSSIASTLGECAACNEYEVTAGEALRLVGELGGAGQLAQDPDREAIEMLGWLELTLDPSPRLVIVGMNDGAVPGAVSADPLIPESLRRALGMPGETERAARDAYLLSAIAGDGRDLTMIIGRRSAGDDPLRPSRLLLRCDGATRAMRVRRFLGHEPQVMPPVRVHLGEIQAVPRFRVCPIDAVPPIESISVTSFKTYLSSSYGYYLDRVLRLGEVEGGAAELDAMSFGTLLHLAIEQFGKSDSRDSTDPHEVYDALDSGLGVIIERQYGRSPQAALRIQLRFARLRLEGFARWQAARRSGGWRIIEQEWWPEDHGVAFDVDGVPIQLRGRIDRIERHEKTGRLAIIDFKTGEKAVDASDAQKRSGEWVDLQLPLYRHLAAELGADDETELAIVSLPRAAVEVELSAGRWSSDELDDADEAAREVVRRIRAGEFGDAGRVRYREGALAELAGIGFVGLAPEQEGIES